MENEVLDSQNYLRLKRQADLLKALAHPTRLFIVEQLMEGELRVQEISEKIQADLSTVSAHLSVLRNAGVVSAERRGRMIFYRLVMHCVLDMLDCAETGLHTQTSHACPSCSIESKR